VQAWVQYYAQGGKDLTGSSYFISVPGLTDGTAPQSPSAQQAAQGQQQAQAQGAAAGATDASAYHQGYAAQQGQPGAANDIPGYSAHAAQAGAYANETPGYSAHAVQAANAYAYGQQPSSPTGSLSRGQSFTAQGAHPHDPQAQYNAQYAQMHGQFAGMGVSERSPTGVTSPQPA
jgi:signal transducing adaptor molecule